MLHSVSLESCLLRMFISLSICDLGFLIYFNAMYLRGINTRLCLLHRINWNFFLFLSSGTGQIILMRSHSKQGRILLPLCSLVFFCLFVFVLLLLLLFVWFYFFQKVKMRQAIPISFVAFGLCFLKGNEVNGSKCALWCRSPWFRILVLFLTGCDLRQISCPSVPPWLQWRIGMIESSDSASIRLLWRLK